ncbi:MAG TPA: hypothetical protein PLU87_06665 [Sedimentisphaerales bacterium]|nr:hypothetical protein [Sedimentisphaerales bacterium]HRS10534.1 hypothetical protein [Sedimentisphaerales bacterium]HRV47242.1 hypothetical protein [Sedimentisphaerales bacterium]
MDYRVSLDDTLSDLLSKHNLVRLLVFWSAGIIAVGLHAGLSGQPRKAGVPSDCVSPLERNETGALTAWRRHSSTEAAPAWRIAFDNLRAENGDLGVFKTASLKVVYVENLRAVLFADGVELSDFHALLAPRRGGAWGANPLGLFNEMEQSVADWSIPVDMANTTEVRIKQLDWRVCQDDRTIFHVQCQHATLRSDAPRMVLRGHVTVTTPEVVLESNWVEMDAKDECIVVPGHYSLKCGGGMRTGRCAQFSKELKPTGADFSRMEGDQGWVSELPLGSF